MIWKNGEAISTVILKTKTAIRRAYIRFLKFYNIFLCIAIAVNNLYPSSINFLKYHRVMLVVITGLHFLVLFQLPA